MNVLLVEDELDLAQTVADYLEIKGFVVDLATNGRAGLNLARQNDYRVIILDINLPQMNGWEVCRHLRDGGTDTPVIMLTARDTLDDKLQGFSSGTDDYLVKPFDLPELVARIQALANRKSGQIKLFKVADLEMDLAAKEVKRAGETVQLTPTCWRILEVLIRNSPNPVSRHELEQQVWGDELPDSNSLKVHLFKLRQKVDKPFAQQLIQTVQNTGFALKP